MSSSRGQSSTSPHSSSRSSTTNSSARASSSRGNTHPAVESAVTRLLVSIKQLLESLTRWSNLQMSENDVSDVYVRLGNDFNAAVAAFSAFGIDMGELMSVPDDLRTVLEQCLAEDATPDNLNLYLPTVRQIITNLLQGLRGKQSIYRRIVSDQKHRSESSGHDRTGSESRRSTRSHRSQPSITNGDVDRRETPPRRSGQPTPSTRRRTDESFIGGFSPSVTHGGELPLPAPTNPPPPVPVSAPSEPPPPTPPALQTQTSLDQPTSPPPASSAGLQSPPLVGPDVKRYSLTDKPVPPPSLVVEPSSPDPFQLQQQQQQHEQSLQNGATPPPPETPPPDVTQQPAMSSSLAALKKSDTLERRASKRFSTYNISKMTGTGARERTRGGGSSSGNRRSLLAVSSALTPGELAALTEADDEDAGIAIGASVRREGSNRSRRTPNASRAGSPDRATPPVPPLPTSPSRTPEPAASPARSTVALDRPTDSSKITVFLQLGREVKKVNIEQGLSLSSLRVLFVDKFSYNPGLENFPAIYIRDPSSGVQYELEDIDEVKEKCLLSLNIEPLDQIKQHIDAQISTLSQDLKELRMAVSTTSRHSIVANGLGPVTAESTTVSRPSDRQFQQVARRLSRFVSSSSHNAPTTQSFSTPTTPVIQSQMTGQSLQPQMTGGSVLSDYSSRVVGDLKTQFDEVQNLRRDLGVMRQLYTEFMKQTKESLGSLRSQTQNVKQLATANIGGARAFIDSGKSKLDVRSQNVLTEVEKLQDTVESLKEDVLKRHVTPKAGYMKTTKKDLEAVEKELASLKEHIQTIKPMWKKTWEEELQNIVEEQQFLTHQEEFMTDLIEDYNATLEVFGHVEQVIGIRGSTSGRLGMRGRSFKPVVPNGEESGGLTSVMMEIRGAQVDPEKRLKAIEANQKNREKDLASRSDELQTELTEFVGQKKLKMTGGADEVERVRQRRNDLTLKAMFTGGGSELPPMPSPELNTPTSAV